MTNYERRKKRMAEEPEYAKAYREKDALYHREYRRRRREAGIKAPSRYIPSIRLGYRVCQDVREEQVKVGYKKYLKQIGKL